MSLEVFSALFEPADVHVARRLTAMANESDESVALAVAIAVRALRGGSVCVDLRSIAEQLEMPELPWPSPDDWLAAVRASPLVTDTPVLRLFGELLYLDRYWLEEQQVCDDVLTLLSSTLKGEVPGLERLFPAGWEEQRRGGNRADTITYGADRRPRHRQDDDGGAAAGVAGRAGVAFGPPAAAYCVGGADG